MQYQMKEDFSPNVQILLKLFLEALLHMIFQTNDEFTSQSMNYLRASKFPNFEFDFATAKPILPKHKPILPMHKPISQERTKFYVLSADLAVTCKFWRIAIYIMENSPVFTYISTSSPT